MNTQAQVVATVPQKGIFDWLAHPFNTQGSALNWVLFVGLLVIAAWFWNHILMTITADI